MQSIVDNEKHLTQQSIRTVRCRPERWTQPGSARRARQGTSKASGSKPRIGDQLVDLFNGGDLEIRDHAPLAVIGHDDDLSAGLLDHLAYDLGFGVGGHGATVSQADAVHAKNSLVGKNLPQVLDGKAPGQGIRARLEFASDHKVLETGLPDLKCPAQVVGEDADAGIAAGMADDLRRGRTAVDEDDVVLLDQGGGQRADAALLLGKGERPLLVARLERHSLAEDRAAMRALEDAFLLEPLQISPHRGFGGLQQCAQVGRARDLVGCQIFLDAISPLRRDQRFAHQTDGMYFIVEGN